MDAMKKIIEAIAQAGEISAIEAKMVLGVYRKYGVVAFDKVNGSISVKHGAFMDKAVILRALSEASQSHPARDLDAHEKETGIKYQRA